MRLVRVDVDSLIDDDVFKERSIAFIIIFIRKLQMTTLADLFADLAADIQPTAAETDAWNTIDPLQVTPAGRLRDGKLGVAAAADTISTSIGLFGGDLTAFLDACTTLADTTVCDPADYDAYNGWAVGVLWSDSATTVDGTIRGVVFETSLWSVQNEWDDTENVVSSGIVDEVSATTPTTTEDGDLAVTADAFEAWDAELGVTADD